MVNEVKLDHMDNVNNLLTAKTQKNIQKHPITDTEQDGVRIHLKTFQDIMLAESMPDDNARVLDMKRRVESGNYKVDTDELAKKLFHHVFQNNRIIG